MVLLSLDIEILAEKLVFYLLFSHGIYLLHPKEDITQLQTAYLASNEGQTSLTILPEHSQNHSSLLLLCCWGKFASPSTHYINRRWSIHGVPIWNIFLHHHHTHLQNGNFSLLCLDRHRAISIHATTGSHRLIYPTANSFSGLISVTYRDWRWPGHCLNSALRAFFIIGHGFISASVWPKPVDSKCGGWILGDPLLGQDKVPVPRDTAGALVCTGERLDGAWVLCSQLNSCQRPNWNVTQSCLGDLCKVHDLLLKMDLVFGSTPLFYT